MIEQLKAWDEQALLFINKFHAPWLDPVMMWITRTDFWIPLYLFLIYLIIINYKKEAWIILIGVIITIVLADQITYSLMKPYFQRLRPSQEPLLEGIVHIVDGYRGGLYGFASSHAANTSGVALFMYLLFHKRYKWIWLLFIWAFVMTYSRIYLGVHYPGDIIVGATVGALCGYAGYLIYKFLDRKIKKKSPAAGPEI